MIIGFPNNSNLHDQRTALIPAVAEKLIRLDLEVWASLGIGLSLHLPDILYKNSGVKIEPAIERLLSSSDIILRFDKPTDQEIQFLKKGSLYICFLNPLSERETLIKLGQQKINVISMALIPRTTKAQKMDALSSQASLAGYAAVIFAAQKSQKIFPMQMTAAGTISPVKVFVIGAGVAGLQAIATAKRLGARVEAFDTRPATAEQVQSLGANFLKIHLGETGQTQNGYAQELSDIQIQRQRDAMNRACAHAHIVITTAQVFGKKAPLLITRDMIAQMKPGSIIIDMAVDSGGNVEMSKANQEVTFNGIKIFGLSNLASSVAWDASAMYANNLYYLIEHCWNKEAKTLEIDPSDEILKSCLVAFNGKIYENKTG